MISLSIVWDRIKQEEGDLFHTKTGLPFFYEIDGDYFSPDHIQYKISKKDFEKALMIVPIDGPGVINDIVRGPAYIWAVLHDKRIRGEDW